MWNFKLIQNIGHFFLKRSLGQILLFIVLVCSVFFGYKGDKKEILPSFNVLLMDSSTVFSTDTIPYGKPFVMMYFSPDCEHCQKQVEDLLKNMDRFRNIHFYFFTPFQFHLLKSFYEYYHLYNYPNITIGFDNRFFLPNHFNARSTPWVFIYNDKKRLERVYEGGLTTAQLMDALSKI